MIVARGYITLTNIQGSANLLDWQSQWREGELPAGWSLNGVAAENSIIVLENPFATKALMWKCTPNADRGPSGGFHTPSLKLDNIHTYRYTAFVYREKASEGTIYHGCFNVDNLPGGANTNPWFCANSLSAGKWYLLVGHIHPSKADSTWQLSTSGIYDMTGKRIIGGTDYKLRDPNVDIRLRDYLYSTDDPTNVAYFYNPRLEVCDGNEPSIEQLLQVSTREEIDAVKVEYKSEIQKLDNKIAFSVSEVKSYTDNKAASEASKAVDSVRVGGRNLILNSQSLFLTASDYYIYSDHSIEMIDGQRVGKVFRKAIGGYGCYYYGFLTSKTSLKPKANTTYVWSLDIRSNCSGFAYVDVRAGYNNRFRFDFQSTNDKWVRISQIISISDLAEGAAFGLLLVSVGGTEIGDYVYYRNPMIVEGNKTPSDWSPAPEDVTADAQAKADAAQAAATAAAVDATNKVNTLKQETNAQLTILSDQIASKVSTATFNALGNRVSAAESTITQHSNQIASKVSQSTFDALGNRVTAAESSITQIPAQIALAVSTSEEKIKTSLTLDSTGISLLGRKISLTGVVTFSALASDAQSKVNTAQSTANTASSKADAAQSTANSAVSKADTAQSGLNTLIGKLGDLSYLDMVSLAKLDTTIIEGGFIKTNLIDANAIITNSLLAEKIAATDITTSRLTVTDGAKIGGWSVEGNSLITRAENSAKLLVEVSGTKFLRVNDLNTMLSIRSDGDNKTGISISTYGNSEALSITANGNGYAIKSAGSHRMYQRSGEVWNTPGVLWAGRINATGGVQSHWGNGCTVSRADATAVGFYDIYHDLGHSEYYVLITSTPYTTSGDKWVFGMIINKYSNYFTVHLLDANDGPRRCAFEIAIIGRNRYQ